MTWVAITPGVPSMFSAAGSNERSEVMSEDPENYGSVNRLSPEERYARDPEFNRLVDTLEMQIHQAQFTGTELREAAVLAAIKYEMKTVRPQRFFIG